MVAFCSMSTVPKLAFHDPYLLSAYAGAIALGTTGGYSLTKKILGAPSFTPSPAEAPQLPAPNEKEPLSPALWKYLGAAILTDAVATALYFVCPPAAIPVTAVAVWLLCSSGVILANHLVQNSHSLVAKTVRAAHAMMGEVNSSIACALLFPATLFPQFHKPQGNPNGRPILMVNGYLSFGSTWYYLRKRMIEAGFGPVYTMNIGSFNSIKEYATKLQSQVQKIQEETGRKDLALVCHSKGGLVGSYYATHLAPSDGAEVTDIVTLGSPLAGTPIAKLGLGEDAKEMHPNHQFNTQLREKMATHSQIRFFHLASEMDEVVPLESALLGQDPSRQKIYKDLGHLGLLFSSKVANQVCTWLKP